MADVVARQSGEGPAFWMLGGLYEVRATDQETDGSMTVVEVTLAAGTGPPPHTHAGGEAVYVLEGTLKYHIAGDVIEGGPGSFFYLPEGTVENFEATSDVRLLVVYQPAGGMDRLFAEVGEPAAERELPPPPDGRPDIAKLIEVGQRYGMQIHLPER